MSALKQAVPHPPADESVSIINVLSETRPSLCSPLTSAAVQLQEETASLQFVKRLLVCYSLQRSELRPRSTRGSP